MEMREGDQVIPIHHGVKFVVVLQTGQGMYLLPPIFLFLQVPEEGQNYIGHVSEATLAEPRVDLHVAPHLPLEPTTMQLRTDAEAIYTTHDRRDILMPGLRSAVAAPTTPQPSNHGSHRRHDYPPSLPPAPDTHLEVSQTTTYTDEDGARVTETSTWITREEHYPEHAEGQSRSAASSHVPSSHRGGDNHSVGGYRIFYSRS